MKYLNILIEIPAGAYTKYEFNPESGKIVLDHIMPEGYAFPENYGMVEGVEGGDGDFLDAYVLTSQPLNTGVWIETRVIGMIEMEDEHGEDNKLICVPLNDKVDQETGKWQDIGDVPSERLDKLKYFCVHAKDWEKDGWTKVKGIGYRIKAEDYLKIMVHVTRKG